uniref:Uncharacterized protein n=1 Tax=Phenylobacterium glaciei TaxID=2803784 RepID=A0A974P610_9CAUL|nr:hypothetical protein JKL49_12115 [Phenylobacterium glaciei]
MSHAPFTTTLQGGVIAGPVRRPDNFSKHAKGSIHDDATAQKLGFKGGTVAGNIHFEQFPPVMAELFGRDWYRTGNLSLYFLNPTTDGEPVQVFTRAPVRGRRAGCAPRSGWRTPRAEGSVRAQPRQARRTWKASCARS